MNGIFGMIPVKCTILIANKIKIVIFICLFCLIASELAAQDSFVCIYQYNKESDTANSMTSWYQMPDTVKKDGIWIKRYKGMDQKAVKGFYENSVRAHVWQFFLPSGKLQRLHYYKGGVKKYDIRFFMNSMKLRKYSFISDSSYKITNVYARDDQLKKQEKFKITSNNDYQIGHLKHFYSSGVIRSHWKYYPNYNPRKQIDSSKYYEIGELRVFPEHLITKYRENQKIFSELKLAETTDTLFQYSIHYNDGSLKLLSYFKPSTKPGSQLIPSKTWFLWNEKGEMVRTKRFDKDE